MSDASVKWLGGGGPGISGTEESSDVVDPSPVVLWSGDRPAAVIAYRARSNMFGLRYTRTFLRVDGGAAGPFPVESGTLSRPGAQRTEEGYHPGSVITADVDGDGTDELVLPKWRGGVDVVGVRAALRGFPGPGVNAKVATYVPIGAQVARLGTGAVVHVLFDRRSVVDDAAETDLRRAGAPDPYLLVRVDRSGAKRVVLGEPGFAFRSVLAVGALNRPGSAQIDELLVLSRRDEGQDVFLSRHRPDGAPLEPARKVYVPFAGGAPWSFAFLPQSRTAILHAHGTAELHFVEAEKPANWIRRVDLKPILDESEDVTFLGVADAQANPKALVRVSLTVYAVDADGRFFTGSGGGLLPADAPAPLYRVQPPGPKHVPVTVVPSPTRGDEWLVVHTRPSQPRDLTHEEIAEAANRFLPPEKVAKERDLSVASLKGRDAVRDRFIADERKRRGVDAEIKTVDEWRRLLPDSYAATVRDRRETLDAHLRADLTITLEHPEMMTSRGYRDLDGYRAWLRSMTLPAATVFTLCRRGAAVRIFSVDAQLAPSAIGDLVRPLVDWRDGPSGTTVVAALRQPGAGPKPSFGYAVVSAASGR